MVSAVTREALVPRLCPTSGDSEGGRGMDAAEIERLLDAPVRRGAPRADLTGPVTVLASEPGPDGATRLDIQASRLVPLDPDDPALADISVPVPVPATVVVGGTGRLETVEARPLDDETERQARAY